MFLCGWLVFVQSLLTPLPCIGLLHDLNTGMIDHSNWPLHYLVVLTKWWIIYVMFWKLEMVSSICFVLLILILLLPIKNSSLMSFMYWTQPGE